MDNRRIIKITTDCGILMALGMALSILKLFRLPSGGSVSLGIIPLLIIASRYGFKISFFCGIGFGFLLAINGATIIHPFQFILEYPLANACMSAAGLIKWDTGLKATTATILANFLRFHCHVIAGVVFFSNNKDNFVKAFTYSYLYNCGHLVPETIICAAIVWFIASKHRTLCSRQIL